MPFVPSPVRNESIQTDFMERCKGRKKEGNQRMSNIVTRSSTV